MHWIVQLFQVNLKSRRFFHLVQYDRAVVLTYIRDVGNNVYGKVIIGINVFGNNLQHIIIFTGKTDDFLYLVVFADVFFKGFQDFLRLLFQADITVDNDIQSQFFAVQEPDVFFYDALLFKLLDALVGRGEGKAYFFRNLFNR